MAMALVWEVTGLMFKKRVVTFVQDSSKRVTIVSSLCVVVVLFTCSNYGDHTRRGESRIQVLLTTPTSGQEGRERVPLRASGLQSAT
jgi:hypothetical protein